MDFLMQTAGLALMGAVVGPCPEPAYGGDEWIRTTVRAAVFAAGLLLWHAWAHP